MTKSYSALQPQDVLQFHVFLQHSFPRAGSETLQQGGFEAPSKPSLSLPLRSPPRSPLEVPLRPSGGGSPKGLRGCLRRVSGRSPRGLQKISKKSPRESPRGSPKNLQKVSEGVSGGSPKNLQKVSEGVSEWVPEEWARRVGCPKGVGTQRWGGAKTQKKCPEGWGSEGWKPPASHDSPRAQTCAFQAPALQKHHQNST